MSFFEELKKIKSSVNILALTTDRKSFMSLKMNPIFSEFLFTKKNKRDEDDYI